MSDERRAETEHLIALELDRPSVYMGGPSMASRRKAKAILVILDRLRDARGDDEGKRDIMDVFRSDEAMRAFGVDRSPQDKDHETSDAVRGDLHGTPGEWPERQPMATSGSGTPQAQPARGRQSAQDEDHEA
jgi:hypothetical protein